MQQTKTKNVSLFSLISINITAVLSLSSIAYMATIGAQSLSFFIFAAIMFFIPSALISAELSGMYSEDNGGVYSWVAHAFGKKIGVAAIWMEWFNNVISLPATLAATLATLAYIGIPGLANNPHLLFIGMIILLWLVTFFNFLPFTKITILNTLGATLGMVIPGVLIIACGLYVYIHGQNQISIHHINDIAPATFDFATFALLVKVISSYSGIQAVAFHARNIKNPKTNIPISMIITVFIILIITSLATLSLAAIVPQSDLNAMNGLIQGISLVLIKLGLSHIGKYITVFICLGLIAALSTWIISPARAMQEVAQKGLFPAYFAKKNKNGMPTNVLITQAIIGTVLSLVFLFMPTIQSAFAMLIALTSQFTVMMFILIFASSIKLRYSATNITRSFRVGGKNENITLIFFASLGIIACGCGFFLGIFPPKFSKVTNIMQYISLIIIADIIIISIPFIYMQLSKKHKHLESTN